MATGNITVTGSMNTSADLAALVAGGDISITGQGTTTSSFQGLILAEGSFTAKDTTLIGSALTLDKNGSVKLERVRTVAARDLTKIDLSYPVELKEATKSNGTSITSSFKPGEGFAVDLGGNHQLLSMSNREALEAIANQAKDSHQAATVGVLKDGHFIPKGSPEYDQFNNGLKIDLGITEGHWKNFQEQTNGNAVVYLNVFQLDFNKFLKTKGGLRPLLQRVSSF